LKASVTVSGYLLAVAAEDLRAVFDLVPVDPVGVGVDLPEHRHQFRGGVADTLDAALKGLLDVLPGACPALGRGEGGVVIRVAEGVPGVHGPAEGRRQLLGDVEMAERVRHGAVDDSEVREALGDGYVG
jgi:hypothetical protein